jgi:dephospho-CoA kinase
MRKKLGRIPLMILCVTGQMAAGKNFVSSVLAEKGFACIDADLLGHEAVEKCAEKIFAEFGELAAEKKIQIAEDSAEGKKILRKNLGALIFGNAELVSRQEKIVFPYINEKIENFIEENSRAKKNAAVNATVLYKIPAMKKIDFVLYVDSFLWLRIFRAKKRDASKISEILRRFKSQKMLFKNYERTGIRVYRIFNSFGKKSVEKQIEKFLKKIQRSVG